jgi:branched-subunit amino acid transport protein AzlD
MLFINFIPASFSLLIFLCFSVKISQPYKSNGTNKILTIEIVFGLRLVSKHFSEFLVAIKTISFLKLHTSSLRMNFYIHKNIPNYFWC